MDKFKEFITTWQSMCKHLTHNTMILSPLDEYWIKEIKLHLSDLVTEDNDYYIIKLANNIVKIKKYD